MARVFYGSCLCGDVGYRISGTPLRMVQCAASLFVPLKQFRWTRGEDQIVSYRLPAPGARSTAFCRRCGDDLPRASKGEAVLVVPARSLAAAEATSTATQAHVSTGETLNRLPPFG
jgi:hypothetical protein